MLDPPAPVAAVPARKLLVQADDLRIGGIADRVDRELEAGACGAAGVGRGCGTTAAGDGSGVATTTGVDVHAPTSSAATMA